LRRGKKSDIERGEVASYQLERNGRQRKSWRRDGIFEVACTPLVPRKGEMFQESKEVSRTKEPNGKRREYHAKKDLHFNPEVNEE